MIVQRGLLRIFWRQALPATLVGALGLSAYALLWPDVMTVRDSWPGLLIFVQCLLVGRVVGPIPIAGLCVHLLAGILPRCALGPHDAGQRLVDRHRLGCRRR